MGGVTTQTHVKPAARHGKPQTPHNRTRTAQFLRSPPPHGCAPRAAPTGTPDSTHPAGRGWSGSAIVGWGPYAGVCDVWLAGGERGGKGRRGKAQAGRISTRGLSDLGGKQQPSGGRKIGLRWGAEGGDPATDSSKIAFHGCFPDTALSGCLVRQRWEGVSPTQERGAPKKVGLQTVFLEEKKNFFKIRHLCRGLQTATTWGGGVRPGHTQREVFQVKKKHLSDICPRRI